MSGWKPCLIALALEAWLVTSAEAQGLVPGGWSSEFSYQTFVAPGAAGYGFASGYPAYGYGVTLPGLSPYGRNGNLGPDGPMARPSFNYYTPSSQTANAVDPLIGAIRRSTGRKGSR